MSIFERIEKLIRDSGKSFHRVTIECGLPHTAFATWKSGRALPSIGAIIKLAKYFNVTTDYLLGLEPEKEYLVPLEIARIWGNLSKYQNLVLEDLRVVDKINNLLNEVPFPTKKLMKILNENHGIFLTKLVGQIVEDIWLHNQKKD